MDGRGFRIACVARERLVIVRHGRQSVCCHIEALLVAYHVLRYQMCAPIRTTMDKFRGGQGSDDCVSWKRKDDEGSRITDRAEDRRLKGQRLR